jgi:putative FmdB family regulatory protein
MPNYEYGCTECGHKFEHFAAVDDKEKGASLKCPKCGSAKIVQVFSHINFTKTSSSNSSDAAFRNAGGCGPNPRKGCCG